MEITQLITRLFGSPQEIDGGGRFPTRLYRWTLFTKGNLKIHLHHSIGDDWTGDPREYPRRFISVGFAKSCTDETASGLEGLPDRAAWMVLIGKSTLNRQNSTAG